MRTSRAVQKHRISARHGHVESAYIRLPIDKRYVPAMDTAFHRRACGIGSGLGDSMVAIAKLKLHNVADGSDNGIWDECVLWSADYDGDYLVGAADWLDWQYVVSPWSRYRIELVNVCTSNIRPFVPALDSGWLWKGKRSGSQKARKNKRLHRD